MIHRLFIALLLTVLPAPALAAGVVLPIDGYYQRQGVNGFNTHVTSEFIAAHRDGWPTDTGFKNDFTGYHAAVDIEYTGTDEAGQNVPIRAVADGTVIYKQSVTGYGGLIIIRHIEPESVTTLYGHLRLSDSPVSVGQNVTAGQVIGYLGSPFSAETSGARKHLHFGIHKGSALDINGYEQSPTATSSNWYDPNAWLAANGQPPTTASPTLAPSPASSPAPIGTEHRGFWGTIGHFFSSVWDKITP